MLDEYEIDAQALKYWAVGAILALCLVSAYLADLSDFQDSPQNDYSSSIEVILQEKPLNPGQLSRLKVVTGGSPVQGAEVRLDDIYIGDTNSEGIISFEALDKDFNITASINDSQYSTVVNVQQGIEPDENPEFIDSGGEEEEPTSDGSDQDSDDSERSEDQEQESGDSDERDDDQDDSDQEIRDGFELLSSPVTGENNQITVFDQNERISGLEIYVNEDLVGETSEGGTVQFIVPETQEISIDAEGFESRTFEVEVPRSDNFIDVNTPVDQKSFDIDLGESVEVNFDFESHEEATNTLYVNGTAVKEEEGGGSVQYEQSFNAGTYGWYVESDLDGETKVSDERAFEVREQGNIEILDQGTEVRGDEVQIMFRIHGEADEYAVFVNGEQQVRRSSGPTDSYTHEFSNSGTQEIEIKAFDADNQLDTVVREFNTQSPSVQLTWIGPTTADTTTPETQFEIDSNLDYGFEYRLNQEGDTTEYNYWEERELEAGTSSFSYTPDPIPQGTHNYNITVFDQQDEEVDSFTGSFETTEEREFVSVNGLSYQYLTEDGSHLLNVDIEAREDLQYSIGINESQVVEDKQVNTTQYYSSESLGELNSGQEYTANVTFESLETSKTMEQQVTFTVQ